MNTTPDSWTVGLSVIEPGGNRSMTGTGRDRRARPRRAVRTRAAALVAAVALVGGTLLVAVASPANAGHGPFPVSSGIYRIPYADGTQLVVTQDHHNHGPGNNQGNDRIDMVAGAPPATVVAAASGTVMAIVDIHGSEDTDGDGNLDPGEDLNADGVLQNGDGLDINGQSGQLLSDGVTVHADVLEHSCQDATEDTDGDGTLDPGEDQDGDGNLDTSIPNTAVIGLCQSYNNYIWIRHPNGEWTKYTHMATGSVTGAPGNLSVGDTVAAGQAMGIEADVGRATGRHLHHEVALPTSPTDDTPFAASSFVFANIPGGGNAPPAGGAPAGYYAGGFIQGTNQVPLVCDIPGNLYADNLTSPGNNAFTANPCNHQPPTADAGGPYVVNEGSVVQLDGTGSTDPEGNPLTYQWLPVANLDDPTLAQPTYAGIDDGNVPLALIVYDQIEALPSVDFTGVSVNNVAPMVTAVGDAVDEGLTASVSATFEDPGILDTHDATVDWGDGTAQPVTVFELAAGVSHVYGDNGAFDVTVTVTDDDGGVGVDTVAVVVGNIDPTVSLDDSDAVSFPGGLYAVVEAGGELVWSADGTDPGSDDLTFTWGTGDVNTYFNGGGPDLFPSPFGTFPFAASDQVSAGYPAAGVDPIVLTLSDDDGGTDEATVGVVVTGTAEDTQGSGWWKHQFSGKGAPQVDLATRAGYLEVVNAVSGAFSEAIDATTFEDVLDILSPTGGDFRGRATAELMVAWLQFASGAVAWDAMVPLSDGTSIGFLDLMVAGEGAVLSPATSNAELLQIAQDLARVRHAS